MHRYDFRLMSMAGATALSLLAASPASATAEPARDYIEASSYLRSDAEFEAWYGLVHRLRRDFDDICGDTFCEGDYSNIQSLSFRCSVERSSGRIGQCLWLFAASNEDIDPATGRVNVQFQHWRCRAPLASRTTMEALLGALAGDTPMRAPLPGTPRTLYDGLIDCL
ncbi:MULTISPECIES: hypothetical protein [unclassified Lysobacter]|uniref:hypothetical protein n=1 Tax=unclassified Lysobacter TaxID=2635362 RepID=UPI000AA73192|nr:MULTISPECIES: hypothetical protein [unclassified Lysobacter]